jgi:hypothetical protein
MRYSFLIDWKESLPMLYSKSGCKALFAEWKGGWWRYKLCPSNIR